MLSPCQRTALNRTAKASPAAAKTAPPGVVAAGLAATSMRIPSGRVVSIALDPLIGTLAKLPSRLARNWSAWDRT